MNTRPYLSACLLATATIAGLIGAMVTEGWANWFFMLLAAGPLAFGAACTAFHSGGRRLLNYDLYTELHRVHTKFHRERLTGALQARTTKPSP